MALKTVFIWSKILLILYWVHQGAELFGQSSDVTVIVLDGEGNDPLPLATVLITPGDHGEITDEQGRTTFTLEEGSYNVTANFLGYREVSMDLEVVGDTIIQLSLMPEGEILQTIEVVGNNVSDRIKRPILGVQRLNEQQLKELPAVMGETDVLKGLQLLAGVSSAGEASNGISVRGGSIDQNLVLMDHVPIFNPTHLFGLFSVFPTDGVQSAELYQGNIPARFGGRVASVLDVQIKSPNADKLHLTGGVGLVSSRLSIETPIAKDKLYVFAAARASFNDFWFDLIQKLKDTKANFGDGVIKFRYQPTGKHIFNFTGFYSKDYYQINLINRFAGFTADKNIYDYKTLNLSFDWNYRIDNTSYIQTVVSKAGYDPQIRLPQPLTGEEAIFSSGIDLYAVSTIWNKQKDSVLTYQAGLQLNYYRNAPGDLDPGNTGDINPFSLPEERAAETSVFSDVTWSPSQQWSFSFGLRYAHYFQLGPFTVRQYNEEESRSNGSVVSEEDYGSGKVIKSFGGLEPRLGIRWGSEKTALKFAYALNRQYLQNIFNSTTPLPTSRWKTSDIHIKPQKSHLLSAGIQSQVSNDYEMGVEVYGRLIDGLLEYRPGADFFLKKFVETDLLQGDGRAYGIELNFRKHQGKNTGWINYSYSRSFIKIQNDRVNDQINEGAWYPSNFDQPHQLNAVYTLNDGAHHSLSLNFTLSSGRPYTIPNGDIKIDDIFVPIYFERNNGRLPTYHRLDMSWTIKNPSLKNKRWVGEWIFTVYNIYGRKNAQNIYYGPRAGSGFGEVFKNSNLGAYRISIFAAPVVSLTYQFKFS